MSDNDAATIRVAEVRESQYGEEAIIDSPFEAKDYIKHLPWKEYSEEVSEHGSLKGKAESRGTNVKTSDLMQVFNDMEQYGFSDDFATHVGWDPDGLGPEEGAWTIDVEAVDEAVDFWQFAGFKTVVEANV